MNVLSLFDGMSCGQIALNRLGIKYDKYYAAEIDKYSISVTMNNYPNTIQLGDVCNIKSSDLPKIDLIMGGSPCQSFSTAGDGTGFNGKSGLFWEYHRILNEINPKYFLLENVVMKKEWQDVISKALNTDPILINSKCFVPQNRPRLYWTNIPISDLPNNSHCINDILDTLVDNKYYLSELQKSKLDLNYKWSENEIIRHKGGNHHQDNIYRYDGIMGCLIVSRNGAASYFTKTYLPNGELRRLTENEVEKLQGIPIDYTKCVSSSRRYEMIGNGWTIDVIAHILKQIK